MASAQAVTDHDQIRDWAEARGARPSCVKGTGGKTDPGMIRLDFAGYSGEESLQEISWDEWFQQFDENNLALLIQEETRGGQKSNFNKLVSREAKGATSGRSRKEAAASKAGGARKQAARKRPGVVRKQAAGKRTGGARKQAASKGAGGARKQAASKAAGSRRTARKKTGARK